VAIDSHLALVERSAHAFAATPSGWDNFWSRLTALEDLRIEAHSTSVNIAVPCSMPEFAIRSVDACDLSKTCLHLLRKLDFTDTAPCGDGTQTSLETNPPGNSQVTLDISTLPWDSPEFYPHAHALAGKRLGFIEHKGKRILNINSAGADFQLIK